MEENGTPVDAGQVSAESSQAEQPAAEVDTGVQAAPAEQQTRQPQTREENAAFAQMRRQNEALQRELDDVAVWAYGEHGVKNYDELRTLRQNMEYQQKYGVDRTAVEPIVQEAVAQHPDVIAAREYKYALMLDKEALAMAEKLPEAGVKNGDELRALIEADAGMVNLVYDKGLSPMQAYRALYGDDIAAKRAEKAAQDTIAKISANAVATPGPVGNAADAPITFTEAQLKNPDQNRLVSDDAYYKAYMKAYRQTKG